MKYKPTTKEINELAAKLDTIVGAVIRTQRATDKARKVGCLDINGELCSSIWYMHEVLISTNDIDGWLDWYVYENGCGKDAKEAKSGGMDKMIKVRNLKHLALIMLYSKNEKEQGN